MRVSNSPSRAKETTYAEAYPRPDHPQAPCR
jgi:hypothetical protein